jgi:hypothetical protein
MHYNAMLKSGQSLTAKASWKVLDITNTDVPLSFNSMPGSEIQKLLNYKQNCRQIRKAGLEEAI